MNGSFSSCEWEVAPRFSLLTSSSGTHRACHVDFIPQHARRSDPDFPSKGGLKAERGLCEAGVETLHSLRAVLSRELGDSE